MTLERNLPWTPGEYMVTLSSESSGILTATVKAQPDAYIVRFHFGGYSKSGAVACEGGGKLLFTSTLNPNEILLAYKGVDYYGDNTFRVEGVVDHIIRPNEGFRATHWYDVKNDSFGNAYLHIQFIAPLKPTKDAPTDAQMEDAVGVEVDENGRTRVGRSNAG